MMFEQVIIVFAGLIYFGTAGGLGVMIGFYLGRIWRSYNAARTVQEGDE